MISSNNTIRKRTAGVRLRYALDGGPAAATSWSLLRRGIMQRRRILAIVFALEHLLTVVNSPKTIRYRPAAFNLCGAAKVLRALPCRRSRVQPRIFTLSHLLKRPTLYLCGVNSLVYLIVGVRRLLRRILIDLSPLRCVSWVHESLRRAF